MKLRDYLREPEPPLEPLPPLIEPGAKLQHEIVVDRKTGHVRQAGSSAEGPWLRDVFKPAAEASLFTFARGVMGRDYLTEALHRPLCDFVQDRLRPRKLALFPREHCKTSIVSHCLPPHMFIQPAATNVYFPGVEGSETTILLAGETEQRATDNLRVIETAFEANDRLRGLWPHRCWDKPRAESKKWNDKEMILPRQTEYPDPSVRAVGVGGAITGLHPRVLIKDDLISFEAANSPSVMQTAIQWHVASRALINDPSCLEVMIGTRWAAYDLYRFIQETDPSVEVLVRAAIEDGEPIYPEKFTLPMLDRLRKEFGVLFPLLYMNTAVDASLTDFDMGDIRMYRIVGSTLVFDEGEADLVLRSRHGDPEPAELAPRTLASLFGGDGEVGRRGEYLRLKYG